MAKVVYLANQMYAADSLNLSCSEGNFTFKMHEQQELTDIQVSALFKDSPEFLASVNAKSIVIEGFKPVDEYQTSVNKLKNIYTMIEEGITIEGLQSAIDFKTRDRLSTLIAEKMADKILPKIFEANTAEPPVSSTPEA